MADLSGAQWRMHTNIKAAPNSQGTLFQGGNPTRYPRHFTPERREMVTNAVNLHPDVPLGGNKGQPSANPAIGRLAGEYAVGLDNIARSSIPVEHLAGLTVRFGALPGSSHLPSHDTHGTYKGSGFRGEAVIRHGRADTETVQHEIGHHHSRMSGTTSSRYSNPGLRGAEEGYAENYAETHHRDYAGKPVKIDRGPEAWASKEADPDDRNLFRRQFTAMRQAGAPAHSNWPEKIHGDDPAPQHEQTELLRRFASGNGEHHWNYAEDAPAHLERQVPGSEEADRRKLRRGHRFLEARGLQMKYNEAPPFNHFPSGIVR